MIHMKTIWKSKEMSMFLILIIISLIITLKNPVFLSVENILDMLKSNVVLGIMAMGMLVVIISGGIDVSVGAMIAAITVIVGNFLVHISNNILLSFLVGGFAGIIMGGINGLLVSMLEIPPIVVTLGTMSIINGVMLYYTNGNWINDIPNNFINFGTKTPLGIPIQIYFFFGAAILTWFILKYTLFGRGVYAIGGNLLSAQRIGYNVKRIKLLVYTLMGFLTGIAAVVHTSIMKQVDPNAFTGFELQVIGAVVLGGANVAGGMGSVGGTIVGVLLMAVINNGLILMHIPTFWQRFIIGLIIVLAVSFDVIQRKRSEKQFVRVDVE